MLLELNHWVEFDHCLTKYQATLLTLPVFIFFFQSFVSERKTTLQFLVPFIRLRGLLLLSITVAVV
jgi:hypothetical protein